MNFMCEKIDTILANSKEQLGNINEYYKMGLLSRYEFHTHSLETINITIKTIMSECGLSKATAKEIVEKNL